MPAIIRAALGDQLGRLLLCDVVLAITVCTLTVHAAVVRLVFAMARDNGLPGAEALAKVPEASRAPTLPAILLGAGAIALLAMHADFPQVVEVMASVAIVWANLAYLFVTAPLLARRLRGEDPRPEGLFHLGRWGLPVNALAVAWGLGVVVNMGYPRPEVYGEPWHRRYIAPLATAALLAVGAAVYGMVVRHRRAGVLEDHTATWPVGGSVEGGGVR
jgi:amino acid transporter